MISFHYEFFFKKEKRVLSVIKHDAFNIKSSSAKFCCEKDYFLWFVDLINIPHVQIVTFSKKDEIHNLR